MVATTNHPALTISATVAPIRCSIRLVQLLFANTRYARPKAGSTSSPCIILVRNANPSATPTSASQRPELVAIARTRAYPAAVISNTSSASGLLNRNISAAAGVNASTAPAISPATVPCFGSLNVRRIVAYSRPTAATPIRACGASAAQLFTPKIRIDNPVTHSAAGGLSTVMKLAASSEPKNQARQLCEPACAAAA